jgi:hypothetical protein
MNNADSGNIELAGGIFGNLSERFLSHSRMIIEEEARDLAAGCGLWPGDADKGDDGTYVNKP